MMTHYQDSSSDDVPYLPPDQYQNYEEQQRIQRLSQNQPQPPAGQRTGRSFFTEDELRELDSPTESDNNSHSVSNSIDYIPMPTESRIPRPPSSVHYRSDPDLQPTSGTSSLPASSNYAILASPAPVPVHVEFSNRERSNRNPNLDRDHYHNSDQNLDISWGRRVIGILLITIPAVLFSAAVHFVDWSMSDFQLFSSSFFIFQGTFWPCLGILIADKFCVSKQKKQEKKRISSIQKTRPSSHPPKTESKRKWILASLIFIHANLSATAMILQLLSIQHLNVSLSLALSFGFDVVVILISYILERRSCSLELILLAVVSYCGYGVAAVPAFVSDDKNRRRDTSIGVGGSVGVMLLSVAASFLLSHLRKNKVRDSVVGTSFAFFGCIQSLITKEIMGSSYNLKLDGKAVGWAAGLISVVFLGTIFFFLETRLSSLIWKRDEDEDEEGVKNFSSLTRTRLAIFILSCLWELSRQGFRDTSPDPYDILGGLLVFASFLLAGGFQAWLKNAKYGLDAADSSNNELEEKPKFCAFLPWLFSQNVRAMTKSSPRT